MAEICVVHLVRSQNGVEPFKFFLDSYFKNPGGIHHDLLIIYKGFSDKREVTKYDRLLRDQPHHSLFVSDWGFDIRPYFVAVGKFNYKYYCFLNSFSVILDKEWLAKMHKHISNKDVGIVGATGSYESLYTDSVNIYKKNLPLCKRSIIKAWARLLKFYFDPFPNYHVRTNAFIISGDIMLALRHRHPRIKMEAWLLESGKNSITKQIIKMNKRALVVGKDGIGYEKEDWIKSNTFWQGEQTNLLISDNQTNNYLYGDIEKRRSLSRHAWGPKFAEKQDDTCSDIPQINRDRK